MYPFYNRINYGSLHIARDQSRNIYPNSFVLNTPSEQAAVDVRLTTLYDYVHFFPFPEMDHI